MRQFQVLMSMQMDAYLKKEQIGTLFVLVEASEGGFRGGGQGGPPQKDTCHPKIKNKHLLRAV